MEKLKEAVFQEMYMPTESNKRILAEETARCVEQYGKDTTDSVIEGTRQRIIAELGVVRHGF